ncbi:MAG: protein phosphatase 2C domain-containing protein [Planctomycetales bacterium]|nr:protein phosphatase 2C domain-containing protein [Planctomycetales bacterium]
MIFESRAFWLPKDLAVPDAYEDAYSLDPEAGQAAICDGVSSAIFSGVWARILAASLAGAPPDIETPGEFDNWLKACRKAWRDSVDQADLAWHQKAKLEEGAASTALWIELFPDDTDAGSQGGYRFRCRAVGDCCLLHVRNEHVLSAFPMDSSGAYEQDPVALRTRVAKQDAPPTIESVEGECQTGDLLVLATDAVAAWAVRRLESGEQPEFEWMWNWRDEDWRAFIVGLRDENRIRHDDSTLLLLKVLPAAPDGQTEVANQTLDRLKESKAGRWLRNLAHGD